MLRLRTNVTTSPTVAARSSSASCATAATSGPRARNSVDELVDAGLLPEPDPVEHLGDAPHRR